MDLTDWKGYNNPLRVWISCLWLFFSWGLLNGVFGHYWSSWSWYRHSFLPLLLLWAVYVFGHQQGILFVSVSIVVLNNNVCDFGGGVNPNFWSGIFFLLWIFNLTDWKGYEIGCDCLWFYNFVCTVLDCALWSFYK